MSRGNYLVDAGQAEPQRAARAALTASKAGFSQALTPKRYGRVFDDLVRSVTTWAGHGHGVHLDDGGGRELERALGAPSLREGQQLFARYAQLLLVSLRLPAFGTRAGRPWFAFHRGRILRPQHMRPPRPARALDRLSSWHVPVCRARPRARQGDVR